MNATLHRLALEQIAIARDLLEGVRCARVEVTILDNAIAAGKRVRGGSLRSDRSHLEFLKSKWLATADERLVNARAARANFKALLKAAFA